MKCNVGGTDKAIRLVVAAVAVVAGIGMLSAGMNAVWAVIAFVVALIAGVTAVVGFCPLNQLLGIDTCSSGTSG